MPGIGPPPKRSEERVRRNKPEVPIEKVETVGEVRVPALGITKPHKIVRSLYTSMQKSGQAKYFEPSDWEFARLTLELLDRQLKAPRPNSQVLATIMSNFTDLLVSEGARRRMRIEIERVESAGAEDQDLASLMLERQAQG